MTLQRLHKGDSICFTGRAQVDRTVMESAAFHAGLTTSNSAVNATVLVLGSLASGSRSSGGRQTIKHRNAIKSGLPIIDEHQFMSMVDDLKRRGNDAASAPPDRPTPAPASAPETQGAVALKQWSPAPSIFGGQL